MFWDNYKRLCEENNTSATRVCKELGISISSATDWKNGALPRPKVRKQIADYFGISEAELLGTSAENSPEYKRFEEATAGFTDRDFDELIAYAQLIRARNKK